MINSANGECPRVCNTNVVQVTMTRCGFIGFGRKKNSTRFIRNQYIVDKYNIRLIVIFGDTLASKRRVKF